MVINAHKGQDAQSGKIEQTTTNTQNTQNIQNIQIVHTARKVASKRIPVSKEVWESLHDLRKPGQTYDQLIQEMIEESK